MLKCLPKWGWGGLVSCYQQICLNWNISGWERWYRCPEHDCSKQIETGERRQSLFVGDEASVCFSRDPLQFWESHHQIFPKIAVQMWWKVIKFSSNPYSATKCLFCEISPGSSSCHLVCWCRVLVYLVWPWSGSRTQCWMMIVNRKQVWTESSAHDNPRSCRTFDEVENILLL